MGENGDKKQTCEKIRKRGIWCNEIRDKKKKTEKNIQISVFDENS